MRLPIAKIPAPVPKQPEREVQADIPPTLAERETLRKLCRDYVKVHQPVPPTPLSELRVLAEQMIEEKNLDPKYTGYTAVILSNEMWRDELAGIPFHRRLLLMPKCLRIEETCTAPFDEFGLLCKMCGQCSIEDLQLEAERLGYAVLVAEGSAIVMSLIETGKIDAIVGVSCLSVLERAFPYMESAAIPGVAVPLLQDDCANTNVDLDTVWEMIHLTRDDKTHRLDLDALRERVGTWFERDELIRLMGEPQTETEEIAMEWLARDGKRWRPFLAVCAYVALTGINPETDAIPDDIRRIAIAVECFHKASLVHDDIEDEDDLRYDQPTVHAEHGVGIALNVGDLMLGDGYRLIGECEHASASAMAQMMRIAAEGHRELCLGQGAELTWAKNPTALKSTEVLGIFKQKTAPAFEVALRLGAAYTEADDETHDVLKTYSENLGIAYQIRDDIEDWFESEGTSDHEALRPTLMPAIALERSNGEARKQLEQMWERKVELSAEEIKEIFDAAGVNERANRLLDAYKEEAQRTLRLVENHTLKGLLRRVMTKIFNDLIIEGWCREFQAANASSGEVSSESVA